MKDLTMKKMRKMRGFTLIELLIVIGLLGALTALVLPSLSADREEALGDVCDYNQAGTVRVLREYHQLYGKYPTAMHSGLQNANDDWTGDGTADGDATFAMYGLPSAQDNHMGDAESACDSRISLTAEQAASLEEAGIKTVCSGTGRNVANVTTGTVVVQANNGTDNWNDDGGNEMTFDGRSLTDWAGYAEDGFVGDNTVVVMWITPTVDWEPSIENANNDWTKGAVKLSVDVQGKCPIPATSITENVAPDFAYYMAYFLVENSGATDEDGNPIPAKLIGTTCPECGVMNP